MKKLTKENLEKVIKNWMLGYNRDSEYIFHISDFSDHYLKTYAFEKNIIIRIDRYDEVLETIKFVDIIEE